VTLTATFLNGTLNASPAESSTDVMLDLFRDALSALDVTGEATIRLADHQIPPGVSHDEGDGDEWPGIRDAILASQILVFAAPIWMGHPSSIAQRAMERLDAFIAETDDRGQMPPVDRVALIGVVGNEDGAHLVGSQLAQCLTDLGFTVPANPMAYWVGEAMGSVDFKDLPEAPDKVQSMVEAAAANGVHLARLLADKPYPALD